MRICIYGSGINKINTEYIKIGYELGKKIAKHRHELVFGGGNDGMMGTVARGVKNSSGKVIGIAPSWIKDFEVMFPNCDEFIYTSSLNERKELFLENSDAFIISPGGIGTLDEFFEIYTLKKLKQHNKPIVIFNINHYYDTLIEMMNFMINENAIPLENKKLYTTTTIDETLNYIENY